MKKKCLKKYIFFASNHLKHVRIEDLRNNNQLIFVFRNAHNYFIKITENEI